MIYLPKCECREFLYVKFYGSAKTKHIFIDFHNFILDIIQCDVYFCEK